MRIVCTRGSTRCENATETERQVLLLAHPMGATRPALFGMDAVMSLSILMSAFDVLKDSLASLIKFKWLKIFGVSSIRAVCGDDLKAG